MKNVNLKGVIVCLLSVLVTFIVILPKSTEASQALDKRFKDIPKNHEAVDAISDLAAQGIIVGYEDGTFRPGKPMTRAEVAKVLVSILDLDLTAPPVHFVDVKQEAWYAPAINTLYASGYISGYGEGVFFKPHHSITRAEIAKLLVEGYEMKQVTTKLPFTDLKLNAWYTPYIQTLYANQLINGTTPSTFSPHDPIKRIDLAVLLANTDYQFGFTLPKPEESDGAYAKYNLDPILFNEEFLKYVNKERRRLGVKPLVYSPVLQYGTDTRLDEIMTYNVSHTRPDGTEFWTVFNYMEAYYRSVGENVASATWSHIAPQSLEEADAGALEKAVAEAFFTMYRISEGHYNNMINSKYDAMSVASKIMPDTGKVFNVMSFLKSNPE